MTIASRDTARIVDDLERRLLAKLGDRTTVDRAELLEMFAACAVDALAAERTGGFHRTAPHPRLMAAKARPEAITLTSEAAREGVAA